MRKTIFRSLIAPLGVLVGVAIWSAWYIAQPPAPDTLYIGDSMIMAWQSEGLLPQNAFMAGHGGAGTGGGAGVTGFLGSPRLQTR
jgi:hypothetical protein